MNPGYPSENVQLQGKNDAYPGPPVAPTVVQYTTVNITPEAPKDHVVWSICTFIYMNPCCLGLAALIFSIKARDRKMAGDMNGAQHYGSTARNLNICATVLVCILIITFLIIVINVGNTVNAALRNMGSRNYYGGLN